MTLKEARKILGKEISDKMSDDELRETIDILTELARHALQKARRIRENDEKPLSGN